jgi:hypothetical protein
VIAVVDKTRNVIFGHFGQLLLKQVFESCQDNGTLSGAIIIDNSKVDLRIAFFYNCRLEND